MPKGNNKKLQYQIILEQRSRAAHYKTQKKSRKGKRHKLVRQKKETVLFCDTSGECLEAKLCVKDNEYREKQTLQYA
jgi:TRAP-type mannitol/chloroaromatic compound transport system substrate-binding protein